MNILMMLHCFNSWRLALWELVRNTDAVTGLNFPQNTETPPKAFLTTDFPTFAWLVA